MAQVVFRGQVAGPRRVGLLPAEATSFVGRSTELAGIASLLEAARMVTVVGPAGVGKTRTALRAAAAAAGAYPDGVWLADLGGISDSGLLASAVAAALGLPEAGTAGTAVLRHLRGRKLLLILDTCEHLVDACAVFADAVLRAAPGVTLIATSRQPLDAPGEHAFPLPPLATDEAVELFAQRAAAVLPGFAVTRDNRADVAAVCRRLDGIPLAIEFAAVRLRALPLPELVSQLESGIRTLTGRRRGASPRHETLLAAVQWSYQLCTPAERTLWERLSVFAGTFGVSGAEDVCAGGALPREQVVPALVGLVDKSVVLRDDADPSRYRLPGALREFGADRLAETDGQERLHSRLAARSLAMARDFDERFRNGARGGDDQAAALRELHREYANIRAALGYALGPQKQAGAGRGTADHGAAERGTADHGAADRGAMAARRRLGAELALRLSCYWRVRGLFDEGRQWLGRVAALFPEPAGERALALGLRGHLATYQGDLASALADINECIRLAAAAGRGAAAEAAAASGYLYLNLALTFAGRHEEARAAGETARERLTARGDQSWLPALEAQLAHLHQLAGDIDQAIECCERGLALLGEPESGAAGPGVAGPGEPRPGAPGRERWISGYLYLISGLALARRPGGERAAAAALRRALTGTHELGDVLGTAYAVEALAWLAAQRGQFERTAWLLGAADRHWARTGRRLSGIALMEESRRRVVKAARRALGERRYAYAYAHGAALDAAAMVRDALDEAGEPPGPRDGAPDDADGGADAGGQPAAVPRAVPAALTRREQQIADLVASGLSNREIAARLFISKRTVDAHVDHIFSKLEISSRVQLTVLLTESGGQAGRAGQEQAGLE